MGAATNWLRNILYGYREVQWDGVAVIQRDVINFTNVQVLDDAVNKRTNVSFSGPAVPSVEAVPNTVVARSGTGATSLTALSIVDDIPPGGVQTIYLNGASGVGYADNGWLFGSSTYTFSQPYDPLYTDALWSLDSVGRIFTATNGASGATFTLDIPDGTTLQSVDVYFQATFGHVGLPAVLPAILLLQSSVLDGTTTLLAGENDASADVTAFENPHAITVNSLSVGSLPVVIDRANNIYRIKFTSESGANALAGCVILGVLASYTTNTYRK